MSNPNDGLLEKGLWKSKGVGGSPDMADKAKYLVRWLLAAAMPTFGQKTSGPARQLHPTAYLDGLRGFAAFLVYWGHHQLWCHDIDGSVGRIFENAWGFEGKHYFVSFPGVRTFFSGGHYAVTVFFVISGYVLSNKPLKLIQAGELDKLGDNLASALFRRYLRLHLPVFVTTFLYMSSWHLFDMNAIPARQKNYREELIHWYKEIRNFTFVFRSGGDPWLSYNFHSWSIPVEFRGSIVIYTSLLAFSRLTRNARLWCELGLAWYFMYIVDAWFCALFMSGMIICDLTLLAQKNALPAFFYRLQPYKKTIFYAMFPISIWFGGCPSHSFNIKDLRNSPGWWFLSFFKPEAVFDFKWFYLFIGGTLLVACIPHIAWLKSFFETRFCQYLGKISFSLYLLHGPVLWTLGDRMYAAVGYTRESHAVNILPWVNAFPLPKTGVLGLEPAFLLPQIVLVPLTLWVAEIGTKIFDEPSLKFAAWLYRKAQGGESRSTIKL